MWFEDSKRIIALTIATSCNTLGIAEGYGISTLFITADYDDTKALKSQLRTSFIFYAVLSTVIFLMVLFTFQSEPQKPPSPSSTVFRDDDILGTYHSLAHNKNFILLTLSHIMYFIAIACLIVNIELVGSWYDISNAMLSHLTLVGAGAGLFGSIILGIVLHKSKVYKLSNILIGVLGASTVWTLYFTLDLSIGWAILSILIIGFILFPALSKP